MSQDKKNSPNKNIIKTPKFNFYWVYGIIFALFIGYQFLNSGNMSSKNLSQNEFENILLENDIEKIVIINKKYRSFASWVPPRSQLSRSGIFPTKR